MTNIFKELNYIWLIIHIIKNLDIHLEDSRFIGHLTGKAADLRGSLTTLHFGYFKKKSIIKYCHFKSFDKTNLKQLSQVRNWIYNKSKYSKLTY